LDKDAQLYGGLAFKLIRKHRDITLLSKLKTCYSFYVIAQKTSGEEI
jgi:hypothetical protein